MAKFGIIARLKARWHAFMHNEKLKQKLYTIIFESDTPEGKLFDILLIVFILLSILITMFDTLFAHIRWIMASMVVLEYLFTIFFTFEYLARLYCSPNPRKYALSFFGIIDLLATLPPYLGYFFHGARFMMVLRSFRLIRIFRVFKLFSFLEEGHLLLESMRQSMRKISVFFLFVVIMVISIGTLMYMVECNEPDTQFTSIPTSIYWAIVTMTTVGYGDITPVTPVGRFLSAVVMLFGYTILAVPTGIVSAQMIKDGRREQPDNTRVCPNCGKRGHLVSATHCSSCGSKLENDVPEALSETDRKYETN